MAEHYDNNKESLQKNRKKRLKNTVLAASALAAGALMADDAPETNQQNQSPESNLATSTTKTASQEPTTPAESSHQNTPLTNPTQPAQNTAQQPADNGTSKDPLCKTIDGEKHCEEQQGGGNHVREGRPDNGEPLQTSDVSLKTVAPAQLAEAGSSNAVHPSNSEESQITADTLNLNATNANAPDTTAPAHSGSVMVQTSEDSGQINVNLLQNSTDASPLHIENIVLTGGDASGVTMNGHSLVVDTDHYQSLNLGQVNQLTYTYDVVDSAGNRSPQQSSIDVSGTNDAPTVNAGAPTTLQTPANHQGNVTVNFFSDVDTGATLKYSIANDMSGFLSIDENTGVVTVNSLGATAGQQFNADIIATDEHGDATTHGINIDVLDNSTLDVTRLDGSNGFRIIQNTQTVDFSQAHVFSHDNDGQQGLDVIVSDASTNHHVAINHDGSVKGFEGQEIIDQPSNDVDTLAVPNGTTMKLGAALDGDAIYFSGQPNAGTDGQVTLQGTTVGDFVITVDSNAQEDFDNLGEQLAVINNSNDVGVNQNTFAAADPGKDSVAFFRDSDIQDFITHNPGETSATLSEVNSLTLTFDTLIFDNNGGIDAEAALKGIVSGQTTSGETFIGVNHDGPSANVFGMSGVNGLMEVGETSVLLSKIESNDTIVPVQHIEIISTAGNQSEIAKVTLFMGDNSKLMLVTDSASPDHVFAIDLDGLAASGVDTLSLTDILNGTVSYGHFYEFDGPMTDASITSDSVLFVVDSPSSANGQAIVADDVSQFLNPLTPPTFFQERILTHASQNITSIDHVYSLGDDYFGISYTLDHLEQEMAVIHENHFDSGFGFI